MNAQAVKALNRWAKEIRRSPMELEEGMEKMWWAGFKWGVGIAVVGVNVGSWAAVMTSSKLPIENWD